MTMNTLLRAAALLAALLAAGGRAAADPPPPPDELNRLLKDQPINLGSWAEWSPRLRAWSGEHTGAAGPAFQRAFDFLKKVQKVKGDRLTLPKQLDRDAVAWMLLAGMYLGDSHSPFGPV